MNVTWSKTLQKIIRVSFEDNIHNLYFEAT
jgi:hypothetical protein